MVCFFAIVLTNSCKKTPQSIPTRDLRDGLNLSVRQLKTIATCSIGACQNKRIAYEAYLKGVVLADDISGNFYKEVYVRDAANTGAIHFSFLANGCTAHIGDSIRLNLKGYDVNINGLTGILEIDSVDFEKHLVVYASGAKPEARQITLSASSGTNNYAAYYGDLVTLHEIGFLPADAGQIYADPIKQLSGNRILQDCGVNKVVVRTSNYASFAQQKTPTGYGTITGIATSYLGTDQMAIRSHTDVNMTGPGCTTYLTKDFSNSISYGGWSNKNVSGTVNWTVSSTGSWSNKPFASISNYTSPNYALCET